MKINPIILAACVGFAWFISWSAVLHWRRRWLDRKPKLPKPVRLSRDAWKAELKKNAGLPGWRDWQKGMFK
jgi:hypothetical protein